MTSTVPKLARDQDHQHHLILLRDAFIANLGTFCKFRPLRELHESWILASSNKCLTSSNKKLGGISKL